MLYIIGLNHRAQARKEGHELTPEQKTFSECVLRTIERVHPILIAEEDSEEALAKRSQVSIAKVIADEKGIEHRFCDPNDAERVEIGYRDGQSLMIEIFTRGQHGMSYDEIFCKAHAIDIGKYFPIRERFWLARLDGCRGANAIFICGDLHIETFGQILEAEGMPYIIAQRGIGAIAEDERYYKAFRYLSKHPDLANYDKNS